MVEAEPTSPLIFTKRGRLLAKDGDVAGARGLRQGHRARPDRARAAREAGRLRPPGRRPGGGRRLLPPGAYGAALRQPRLQAFDDGPRPAPATKARLGGFPTNRSACWPEDFQVRLLHAAFLLRAGRQSEARAAFEIARKRCGPSDPAVDGGFEIAMGRILPSLGR